MGAEIPGPGVFRTEPVSVSHAIVPATTSSTAIVGTFAAGPLDETVLVSSRGEFEAQFTGDDPTAPPTLAACAVSQFFLNGGEQAWIVRLGAPDGTAQTFTDAALAELGAGAVAPRLDGIAPSLFNLMCIPEAAWLPLDAQHAVLSAALAFCERRGAMLLVDPPPPAAARGGSAFGGPGLTVDDVGRDAAAAGELLTSWGGALLVGSSVAGATYYPWIEISDPRTREARLVPPSGSVAGIYARTDLDRGVWKAPAGTDAGLAGVTKLADATLGDTIDDVLNAEGINCLRTFPQVGNVVWGARTMAGADRHASEWKYVNVRRLSAYLEHSVGQSTQWALFEPNDDALWTQVRLVAVQFMNGLFGQGAFQGTTPQEAYFVRCDATTTSAQDIAAGVFNVLVGFAPLRPAEFVTVRIAVRAGRTPPD